MNFILDYVHIFISHYIDDTSLKPNFFQDFLNLYHNLHKSFICVSNNKFNRKSMYI